MAKKTEKKAVVILVNNVCDFAWPLARKLDGGDGHKFLKGEHFEMDAEIERTVMENGKEKKIMVPALELAEKLFPHQITEVKGVISAKELAEKDERIAELEAYVTELEKENAELKKNQK